MSTLRIKLLLAGGATAEEARAAMSATDAEYAQEGPQDAPGATGADRVVALLVAQTIAVCGELATDPLYAGYAAAIARKAAALRTHPTARNAYAVLDDVYTIARAAINAEVR